MVTKQPAMRPTGESIAEVLGRVSGPRRDEAAELVALLGAVSGTEPVVWAGRIIGFGEYEYRYATGHGGRAPELGFATGSAKHTIYLIEGFAECWPGLLERLGRHRASRVCLYLTRLTGIDREVLRELLVRSLELNRERWGSAGGAD